MRNARLRIVIAGALFSTGGALIKSCSFATLQKAGVRAAVAALTLFVLLPEARRMPSPRVLLLLPAYFGATALFVIGTTLTTAANAIFLQSTYPLWVTLLGPLLLHERPRRHEIAVLACVALGMTLFFLAPEASTATAPQPLAGKIAALVSGLSYGLLLLGCRWLGKRGDGEQGAVVAWGNLFTAALALALAPLCGQQLVLGSGGDWAAMLLLGVFQVGAAYALLTRAMPFVPAVQASLLLMIEPALNPFLAFLVHGERPPPLAIGGGAIILGAVALGAVVAARRVGAPA